MQFGQYVVLFAFMLTSVSVAGQFFSSDDTIDRHNYGYMLYMLNIHCSTTNFNRFSIATGIYIEFN